MFNMFRRCCYRKMPYKKCGCPIQMCRKPQCKCTRELLNINEINYKELAPKVREWAILLDVRTKQEFLEGHLEGAILIPYYEIYKKVQNIIPSKDQSIIVYCQNGGRSIKAYEILNRIGYNNVYNLKGGKEGIN